MKQKKYFKQMGRSDFNQGKEELKNEFSEQFGPLYKKQKSRLVLYIKTNPKKSFAVMMLLLGLNFMLMLYLDTRNVKAKRNPFTNIKDYITKTPLIEPSPGQIDPTINNIMTLREIRDSIIFYSEKEHLKTNADTIILKRLLSRYATVDPSIFKSK